MFKIRDRMCHVWLPARCARISRRYLRNVCHLWLSPPCPLIVNLPLSSAQPHSFPHHQGPDQGWLCLLRPVMPRHHPAHFSARAGDSGSFCRGQKRWEESFIFIHQHQAGLSRESGMEMYSKFEGIVLKSSLFAKCSVLLVGSMRRWYYQMLGRYTNKIDVIIWTSTKLFLTNNLNRHNNK